MGKDKKTRQEAATSHQVQSRTRTDTDPKDDCSTRKRGKQIAGLLPRGKENAIPSADLMQMLGVSRRELQARVAREREHGSIICFSLSGGYYLPADRDEVAEFVSIMEARQRSTRAAVKDAKRLLKLPEGQLSLELGRGNKDGKSEDV